MLVGFGGSEYVSRLNVYPTTADNNTDNSNNNSVNNTTNTTTNNNSNTQSTSHHHHHGSGKSINSELFDHNLINIILQLITITPVGIMTLAPTISETVDTIFSPQNNTTANNSTNTGNTQQSIIIGKYTLDILLYLQITTILSTKSSLFSAYFPLISSLIDQINPKLQNCINIVQNAMYSFHYITNSHRNYSDNSGAEGDVISVYSKHIDNIIYLYNHTTLTTSHTTSNVVGVGGGKEGGISNDTTNPELLLFFAQHTDPLLINNQRNKIIQYITNKLYTYHISNKVCILLLASLVKGHNSNSCIGHEAVQGHTVRIMTSDNIHNKRELYATLLSMITYIDGSNDLVDLLIHAYYHTYNNTSTYTEQDRQYTNRLIDSCHWKGQNYDPFLSYLTGGMTMNDVDIEVLLSYMCTPDMLYLIISHTILSYSSTTNTTNSNGNTNTNNNTNSSGGGEVEEEESLKKDIECITICILEILTSYLLSHSIIDLNNVRLWLPVYEPLQVWVWNSTCTANTADNSGSGQGFRASAPPQQFPKNILKFLQHIEVRTNLTYAISIYIVYMPYSSSLY